MTKIWWHSIVIFGLSHHHLTTFTIRIEYSVGKLKDFEKNACVSGHSRVRHPTQMSFLSDTNVDKKVPMISRTSFGAENSHCVARNFHPVSWHSNCKMSVDLSSSRGKKWGIIPARKFKKKQVRTICFLVHFWTLSNMTHILPIAYCFLFCR